MGFRVGPGLTRRLLAGVVVSCVLSVTLPAVARADDGGGSALEDVIQSSDFRVRVSAALTLGRLGLPTARTALEQALSDPHPSVRIAAAESLGALADTRAIAALEQRQAVDRSLAARAQMRATIDLLRHVATPAPTAARPARGVRYVVVFGAMRNATGVRGQALAQVLAAAARTRAQALRGGALLDATPGHVAALGASRLPIFTLDGSVEEVVTSPVSGGITVRVRVEFTVRRDHDLRGTISGVATSFGSGPLVSDGMRQRLENDAIDGAVQSAFQGAERGFVIANR